ncbi:MAG: hypothetical protein OXT09_33105 [Myxococcales bacterium]|nr:hypothetical protein [Myxococcales bacterium]
MALLTRAACALFACALSSCALSEPLGEAEVWIRECDAEDDARCSDSFASGEAFIDRSVSRHAPDGVYLYVELEGPEDRRAILEIDVPAEATDDGMQHAQLRYRELDGVRERFAAEHATGWIDLPAGWVAGSGADCDCLDLAFALAFEDPQRGGRRELESGRAGWGEERCAPTRAYTEAASLEVAAGPCARTRVTRSPAPQPRVYDVGDPEPDDHRCGPDCQHQHHHHDAVYVGGCGSSSQTYDDEPQGCASSGERADYSSSSTSDSSGGCEGDDSNSSSGGGCEGDTSDSPDACRIAPRTRQGPWVSLGIPLLLVCLYLRARLAWLRHRLGR